MGDILNQKVKNVFKYLRISIIDYVPAVSLFPVANSGIVTTKDAQNRWLG